MTLYMKSHHHPLNIFRYIYDLINKIPSSPIAHLQEFKRLYQWVHHNEFK